MAGWSLNLTAAPLRTTGTSRPSFARINCYLVLLYYYTYFKEARQGVMKELYRILELINEGEPFCIATVIASGRAELPAGTKALVRLDGTVEAPGWPSPPGPELRAAALKALAEKKSGVLETSEGLAVFLDAVSPEPELLVCGAGHIAVPLARFARETGFSVTVLDDRPDFANQARFPGCRVLAEPFVPALRGLRLGPSSYAVVITRGHEHDSECLEEILRKKTAYAGLIGSRRRGRLVLETLGGKGIAAERLGEVFTPIGVPIGAESPEEIALAIAAELVAVRRGGAAAARALRRNGD